MFSRPTLYMSDGVGLLFAQKIGSDGHDDDQAVARVDRFWRSPTVKSQFLPRERGRHTRPLVCPTFRVMGRMAAFSNDRALFGALSQAGDRRSATAVVRGENPRKCVPG